MNMTLGYALLRDRRVPIRTKLIALGIGAAGVGAFELLQLPVEGVVAALVPLIGAAGDLALDGAEADNRSRPDRYLVVAPSCARRSCATDPQRNGTHGPCIEMINEEHSKLETI